MKITENNIELLIFKLKEGMLDEAEQASVEEALAGNEEWRRMAEMYDPALQIPDYPHLEYPDKEKLRDIARPQRPRRIALPLWSRVAAACAAIAGIVIFLRIGNSGPDSNLVAFDDTRAAMETINRPMPADSATTPSAADKIAATARNEAPGETMTAERQEEATDNKADYLYTEELITFLDDDDTTFDQRLYSEPQNDGLAHAAIASAADNIRFTDKLVTYYDDEEAAVDLAAIGQQPAWQAAVEDWQWNLQLARLEFQTNMVNNIHKYIERK